MCHFFCQFYFNLTWFQRVLNLMIGIVNLLPIIPFDGGRMFNELVQSFKIDEEIKNKIIYAVIIIGIFILLVNLLPLIESFFQRILNLV